MVIIIDFAVQAVQVNAKKKGLTQYIKTSEGKRMIKQVMSLALLKPDQIIDTFDYVMEQAVNAPQEELAEFIKYFKDQWTNLVDIVSVYQLSFRTNNCLESYHNALKSILGKRPKFWEFHSKYT